MKVIVAYEMTVTSRATLDIDQAQMQANKIVLNKLTLDAIYLMQLYSHYYIVAA